MMQREQRLRAFTVTMGRYDLGLVSIVFLIFALLFGVLGITALSTSGPAQDRTSRIPLEVSPLSPADYNPAVVEHSLMLLAVADLQHDQRVYFGRTYVEQSAMVGILEQFVVYSGGMVLKNTDAHNGANLMVAVVPPRTAALLSEVSQLSKDAEFREWLMSLPNEPQWRTNGALDIQNFENLLISVRGYEQPSNIMDSELMGALLVVVAVALVLVSMRCSRVKHNRRMAAPWSLIGPNE